VWGKAGDEHYIDYLMSEKFGLDWKQKEFKRMHYFLEIYKTLSEESNKKKPAKNKSKSNFR